MESSKQDKAKEIIEEREQIIASQKDKESFFDLLVNAPKPNTDLRSAKNDYDKLGLPCPKKLPSL